MRKEMTIRPRLAAFKKAFAVGIEGFVNAGEIYVAALDDDPRNADKFKKEFAEQVPDSAWSSFEAIGRKWMHPRLLLGGVADEKKNTIIKTLPYSAQERVFNHELIPVIIGNKAKKIDLLSASAEIVEQVCDTTGFRDVKAQESYVAAKSAPREPVKKLPYVITKGKIYFTSCALMSKEELQSIIKEM